MNGYELTIPNDDTLTMSSPCEPGADAAPGEFRPVDEHANFVTHCLGLVLSIVASIALMSVVVQDQPTHTVAACATYCVSLVALYGASTLSHAFSDLERRRFFRMVDQACIFLLIAGSFTPIAVLYLWHGWWPLLLVAMWVLAAMGVLLAISMRNLSPTARRAYGFLGCLPLISTKALVDAAPADVMIWLAASCAFYSIGTLFLRFDMHVRYFHALWHTFVIAGSASHYIALLIVAATV